MVDRGSSPDVCFILFSGCICFVVVALAFHGIPGFVSIISIKFEVSSALKDGSTKELNGLVAQIASLETHWSLMMLKMTQTDLKIQISHAKD